MQFIDSVFQRAAHTLYRCASLGMAAIAFAAVISSQPALAAEDSNLYTAQVVWAPGDESGRARAYAAALRKVLVKITGSPDAAGDPALFELFDDPARLVIGYRSVPPDRLWVSFDGPAVVAALRSGNQPTWQADRPLTLVWLALDRGRGGRDIVSASDSGSRGSGARGADPNQYLRERMELAAGDRGIPVAFPLADAIDRESITPSDIRGGFDDRLLAASRRYNAPSVLIGNATSGGRSGEARWRWHFGGDVREFTGSVEAAAYRVADALAAQFAVYGGTDNLEIVALIDGISSVNALGRTLRLLRSLPQIEAVNIDAADGDVLTFRLSVIGTEEQIERAMTSSGILSVARESMRFRTGQTSSTSPPTQGGPGSAAGKAPPSPAILAFHYES